MRIALASPIDGAAIARLREHHDVVRAFDDPGSLPIAIADREVLVFRSGVAVTAELLEAAPELRLLVRAGSGLDNLDMDAVRERGIGLVRIPEPGAQAVAELTFAFMLALSRNLLAADRSMREARWAKFELEGSLLLGKTLGIVGLGTIGTRVATMGLAWGMRTVGCVRNATPERERDLMRTGIALLPFEDVVAEADHLCLHVPRTEETLRLIDAGVIARMKRGSYLINLARGGVVDEDALRSALETGHLAGAALDVHGSEADGERSPLADLPNVILTPHIGAMATDAQRMIGERVVEIIDEHAASPHPLEATR
ncbi:MAG: NAD(P)-dependent oxidoreductase [Actinomycetota bacterium]